MNQIFFVTNAHHRKWSCIVTKRLFLKKEKRPSLMIWFFFYPGKYCLSLNIFFPVSNYVLLANNFSFYSESNNNPNPKAQICPPSSRKSSYSSRPSFKKWVSLSKTLIRRELLNYSSSWNDLINYVTLLRLGNTFMYMYNIKCFDCCKEFRLQILKKQTKRYALCIKKLVLINCDHLCGEGIQWCCCI